MSEKEEFIYALLYNDEQIDQTSIDEMNENLAYSIMIEDHKDKDKNLLDVCLISVVCSDE